jgi:transposase InsO family protein
MPWENRGVMSLREEFIARAQESDENLSQLCREYGISRKTAYKWISRYEKEGLLGLTDRPRRPLHMPARTDEDLISLIVSARDKYPAWGARKLRQILINDGHKSLPSEATFNRILQRQEKINPKEFKRKQWIRFERKNPNELWQMDFKGYFEVTEGKCHPLTVLDDCSRYSLCLKACSNEDAVSVQKSLEETFSKYGLPEAMTMDNGPPWMGAPGQRLSRLTIWLMKLGIKVGHSRPYHPQTQGKDERFHRSLKEELLKFHNFQDLAEAQQSFDEWRHLYNYVRPHESLGMLCPAQKYQASLRQYTREMPKIEYSSTDEVRKVSHAGEIKFQGKTYFVGECLKGEFIALRQREERKWDVYYVNSWLGSFEKKV